MSTQILVQIPFEESYEEKSSEFKDDNDIVLADDIDDNDSSASDTFIHHIDKSIKQHTHSPNLASLSKVLSSSHKSFKHDLNLIRVVSLKECEILKTNVHNILAENNYDSSYKFNLSEFISFFKKIFRSCQDNEIIKIFNLFVQNDQLSFDNLINNETNFHQLLECMGYIIEYPRQTRESMTNLDTISVKPQYINNKNYMEYIEYQREIIEQLRNEINETYKPMILHNKDMEIKLQALKTENMNLENENQTLKDEIKLLENEILNSNNSSETEVHTNINELCELYNRRISQSNNMYIEIQESHTFLENELMELHSNLKLTKSETDKTIDENYKLKEINQKYELVNNKLTNKYNKINKQFNEMKLKLNNKLNEMNTLKYEIFAKEQTIETLNNLYNDTLLQLQFYQKHKSIGATPSTRKRGAVRNSFELKIKSIPSMQSHNTYSYNSYHKNYSEFDIFNDLLLQSPNNYSRPITPIDNNIYNKGYISDDYKDKLINNLKNDYNILQQKYDYDIIQIRIELEKDIRNQIQKEQKNIKKKRVKCKSIGIQTIKPKKLTWFEKLMAEMRCVPIDENNEW